MKIGYVQNHPIFGEKEKNYATISSLLEGKIADLIVLPELFATGYAFASTEEVKQLSETSNGKTAKFLKQLSKQTGAIIVGGFAEVDKGIYYNSAMMVSNGAIITIYRKLHLFNKEKQWFAPGDKSLSVHEINGIKIGIMICFDWIFPEVARKLALLGAQVIAHPSNLVLPHCQSAMQTRCLENRVFAVTANRIGHEKRSDGDFTFTGGSQITAPNGNVLSKAPTDQVFVEIVYIDPHEANNKMITDYNDVLKDRRTEYY